MKNFDGRSVKEAVREGYARVAMQGESCCGSSSCCGGKTSSSDLSRGVGYSDKEINAVPDGANLGLGCGNPLAIASLSEGETVLDLGSGAGFDCFLASGRVGKIGKVIGVDMTPEMIEKARRNAESGGYSNVEFRLGELENLPVADASVDVIISNCVINLVPDKRRVFMEAFRALKSGGRLMISDIVLLEPLPEKVMSSVAAYVGCLSGAVLKDDYLRMLGEAGFGEIRIAKETTFPIDCMANDPTAQALVEHLNLPREELEKLIGSVVSLNFYAVKS
ncbi:MAG: arsenite methyltransferase [bacterium]